MDRHADNHLNRFALQSKHSAHRASPEPPHPFRTPFEVDRHRVVASTSFRRLEQKTQVFAPSYHDHFRTRLTHTLEAAHIARTLAVGLGANETVSEVITLAHDLGHPPFGHAGEAALDQAMANHGGFNHNAHSLRVVEHLEHPYPAFRGLNLTVGVRAGLAFHETNFDRPAVASHLGKGESSTLSAGTGASVEARIASVADRIAYDMHDLEDAIGAKFVSLEELADLSIWRTAFDELMTGKEVVHIYAVRRLVIDKMLDTVLIDLFHQARDRLSGIDSPQAAERSSLDLVAPSPEMHTRLCELEVLLHERVYRQPEIVAADAAARQMVCEIFDAYRDRPEELPARNRLWIDDSNINRVVCDYVAGMTDRFCRTEHGRITGGT